MLYFMKGLNLFAIITYRDFPDFGDDQFLESDITSAELSTFDFLLAGGEAEPTVTPIKFSKLYKGGSRGMYPLVVVSSYLQIRF